MKIRQHLIPVFCTLLLVPTSLWAQKKVKYEDILPAILASEPTKAIATIKGYLIDEPLNASMFLQMSLIYEKRFLESDPLRQYKRAVRNATLARRSYEGTDRFLNEKEVKKNKAQYVNFAQLNEKGKSVVPYDSIKSRVTRSLEEIRLFEKNVPDIYNAFTESYSHYYRANKIFTEIVGRYKNLKELYLLYDENLEGEFKRMKNHYDSALIHFNRYKEKTAQYDVGYDQQLEVKEIKVYRLDGLAVNINFLQEEIPIWNYSAWADGIRSYVEASITDLRAGLIRNEKLINQRLKRTGAEYDSDGFQTLTVDKELLFNLRKYDLNSVIEPLLLYKQAKHGLLYRKFLNETNDSLAAPDLDRKLYNYGQLINNILKADTILSTVQKRNVLTSYDKYKSFLDSYYSGQTGISTYVSEERATNKGDFSSYVDSIRALTFTKYPLDTVHHSIRHKRVEYPLSINPWPLDSMIKDQPITTHVVTTIDGSRYIGGVKKGKKNSLISSYIMRISPENKVDWYHEFKVEMDTTVADSHTRVALLEATAGRCVFVINGTHAQSEAQMNLFFVYDEEGNEKVQRDLLVDDFPRTIDFVERTNTFLITFKGSQMSQSIDKQGALTMANYNVLGDLLWQSKKMYAGNVTDLVTTDLGFLVVGNYTSVKDANGRIVTAPKEGMGTVVFAWNKEGKGKGHLVLKSSRGFSTSIVHKISDHCINLFGSLDPAHPSQELERDPTKLVHFIITKNLTVLSRSLD